MHKNGNSRYDSKNTTKMPIKMLVNKLTNRHKYSTLFSNTQDGKISCPKLVFCQREAWSHQPLTDIIIINKTLHLLWKWHRKKFKQTDLFHQFLPVLFHDFHLWFVFWLMLYTVHTWKNRVIPDAQPWPQQPIGKSSSYQTNV